jgi:hypothetical protein
MNIYCRGTGSPTVVFDAGLGANYRIDSRAPRKTTE